jgi:hypothetical protein
MYCISICTYHIIIDFLQHGQQPWQEVVRGDQRAVATPAFPGRVTIIIIIIIIIATDTPAARRRPSRHQRRESECGPVRRRCRLPGLPLDDRHRLGGGLAGVDQRFVAPLHKISDRPLNLNLLMLVVLTRSLECPANTELGTTALE